MILRKVVKGQWGQVRASCSSEEPVLTSPSWSLWSVGVVSVADVGEVDPGAGWRWKMFMCVLRRAAVRSTRLHLMQRNPR